LESPSRKTFEEPKQGFVAVGIRGRLQSQRQRKVNTMVIKDDFAPKQEAEFHPPQEQQPFFQASQEQQPFSSPV